jgi:hypothetical protein
MDSEARQSSDDKTVEKAVWHYTGVGVLWIALLLSGVALERLGLTSNLLAGILPGETGSLRAQATECRRDFERMKADRDLLKRQEDTLQAKIRTLEARAASSAR